MRLAAIQFRADKGDWERSADRLLRLVTEAAQEGADLIVCPEMALTGYVFADQAAIYPVTEPARGRTLAGFAPVCARYGCHLVIGYPERELDGSPEEGRLYNSALVIGPQEPQLRCNYRKTLLYQADTTWATPGDGSYPLLDTPVGLLTAGICMDLNDDRFTAFLRRCRPQVLAFPTNWIHQGFDIRPYWRLRLRAAGCYLVAADTYGVESDGPGDPTRFLGRSAILAPDGTTLALAQEVGDEVIAVDVPAPCPS